MQVAGHIAVMIGKGARTHQVHFEPLQAAEERAGVPYACESGTRSQFGKGKATAVRRPHSFHCGAGGGNGTAPEVLLEEGAQYGGLVGGDILQACQQKGMGSSKARPGLPEEAPWEAMPIAQRTGGVHQDQIQVSMESPVLKAIIE